MHGITQRVIITLRHTKHKEKEDINTLRDYLKDLRKKSGLTQIELAKKLNLTQSYYSHVELGTRMPTIDLLLLVKISDFYGVPIEQLIKEELKVTKEGA